MALTGRVLTEKEYIKKPAPTIIVPDLMLQVLTKTVSMLQAIMQLDLIIKDITMLGSMLLGSIAMVLIVTVII